MERILVPVDFSELSCAALDEALELARALGARLHLVHAVDVLVYRGVPYEELLAPESEKRAEEKARAELETWAARAREAGVEAETHLVRDDARDAIVRTAAEVGAELVVMGSHGERGWRRALLGSVAEHVVRAAPCSVYVVKRRER